MRAGLLEKCFSGGSLHSGSMIRDDANWLADCFLIVEVTQNTLWFNSSFKTSKHRLFEGKTHGGHWLFFKGPVKWKYCSVKRTSYLLKSICYFLGSLMSAKTLASGNQPLVMSQRDSDASLRLVTSPKWASVPPILTECRNHTLHLAWS